MANFDFFRAKLRVSFLFCETALWHIIQMNYITLGFQATCMLKWGYVNKTSFRPAILISIIVINKVLAVFLIVLGA